MTGWFGGDRGDEGRSDPKRRTAREKGLGFAYLILVGGALLLALPLTGILERDEPDPDECVPGYAKCLDPAAADYDCETDGDREGDGGRSVSGPIVVTGGDPFELDPDGDGFACV